jgi:hypothetical protein
MWILNLLPTEWILGLLDYVAHLALIGGAAAYVLGIFARRFIFTENYGLLLKVVGAAVFIIAVFFEGIIFNNTGWKEKVAEMENKVAAAEQKSADANSALEAEQKKKQEIVIQYRDVVKKEIQVQREIINKECKLDDQALEIYNKSVTGPMETKK